MEVDASAVGVGAVLSRRSAQDGELHPCVFLSHRLTPPEVNYDVGNRKLEEWRCPSWSGQIIRIWLIFSLPSVSMLAQPGGLCFLVDLILPTGLAPRTPSQMLCLACTEKKVSPALSLTPSCLLLVLSWL